MRKQQKASPKLQLKVPSGKRVLLLWVICGFLLLGYGPTLLAKDTCIDCHRNPDFIVTNKKLFDYFKEWNRSIHAQEGVTCSDCHGGNPEASKKNTAHGGKGGTMKMQSSVNFRNIPETCGQCHDNILDSYRKSNHFRHLKIRKQEQQGPNCVTCHGSLNSVALNVNTVKQTCLLCHNPKSGNHPEIPEKAEWLLNKFLSIHRLFRYVSVRGDTAQNRDYVKQLNIKIERLSEDWHQFDLASFQKEVTATLDSLKEKRNQIRKKRTK